MRWKVHFNKPFSSFFFIRMQTFEVWRMLAIELGPGQPSASPRVGWGDLPAAASSGMTLLQIKQQGVNLPAEYCCFIS